MGIDCTGLKPANRIGEYFHNTIWAWSPLWTYVSEECADILSKRDVYRGHYNSSHKISKEKATAMGKRLHRQLRSGKTQAYSRRIRRSRFSQVESPALQAVRQVAEAVGGTGRPLFYVKNVREFADFCLASGGFEIT